MLQNWISLWDLSLTSVLSCCSSLQWRQDTFLQKVLQWDIWEIALSFVFRPTEACKSSYVIEIKRFAMKFSLRTGQGEFLVLFESLNPAAADCLSFPFERRQRLMRPWDLASYVRMCFADWSWSPWPVSSKSSINGKRSSSMLKEIIPSLPTRLLSCILRGGEVVVHFVFLIRSGKSFFRNYSFPQL